MPKPWAKYEIGYIRHAKFLALTGNATALWWEAKNYCDEHLTDGLFPREALRTFRFNAPKSVELLTRSCGPKPNGTPYAPLWEALDIGGVPHYRMHDYLDHNECRDQALKRMKETDDKRKADRDRLARWRDEKKRLAETRRETPVETPSETALETPDVTPMKRSIQIQQQHQIQHQKEPVSLPRARVVSDDDLGDRARELLERYPIWYAQERHGARLPILGGNLQFQDALTLCRTWDDDAHIEKLARIVLTATDDDFINRSDRGWRVFVTKAAWADDRYRQWVTQNGVAV